MSLFKRAVKAAKAKPKAVKGEAVIKTSLFRKPLKICQYKYGSAIAKAPNVRMLRY
jgi:hypothetical protein